jgi:hypothetical protein
VRVALVIQQAKRMRHIIYHIFPYYLANGTIFEKKSFLTQNVCVDFLYNFFSETLLIPRGIQRDIIINVHTSSCKVPVIIVGFQ